MKPLLHDEAMAAQELVESLRGWDEGDISLSIESETDLHEVVSACIIRLNELDEHAAACRRLADGYRERATALAAQVDRLRETVTEALQRSGAPMPLRLPEATVTISNPAPSARVIDPALIPDAYMRTKVTRAPDLRSITETLRQGLDIPGAALANARPSLVVRRA